MRYKVTKAEAAWYLNKFDVDGNKLLDKSEVRALLDSIEQIPDPAFAVEGNDHVMSIPKVNDVELDLLMRLTSDESESILRVPAQRVMPVQCAAMAHFSASRVSNCVLPAALLMTRRSRTLHGIWD